MWEWNEINGHDANLSQLRIKAEYSLSVINKRREFGWGNFCLILSVFRRNAQSNSLKKKFVVRLYSRFRQTKSIYTSSELWFITYAFYIIVGCMWLKRLSIGRGARICSGNRFGCVAVHVGPWFRLIFLLEIEIGTEKSGKAEQWLGVAFIKGKHHIVQCISMYCHWTSQLSSASDIKWHMLVCS